MGDALLFNSLALFTSPKDCSELIRVNLKDSFTLAKFLFQNR
jgi:hypothetical protein